MKKSLGFWLYFCAAIIFATYFSARIIMTTMGRGNASLIKSVSVFSMSKNRDLSGVAAAAGIMSGTDSYSIKLSDVADRISMLPDVKTAAVRRLSNGNISIRVSLHQGIAFWTDGAFIYPISADGTIINKPLQQPAAGAVLFRGIMPGNITDITKAVRGIGVNLNYLEFIESRRWNIITVQNITVLLPEENAAGAINNLILMEKNHKILSRDISIIDMRDADKTIIK